MLKESDIFRKKHELWLKILYTSLTIKDNNLSLFLKNIAENEFRHMKWLGLEIVEMITGYDYENPDFRLDLIKPFDFDIGEMSIYFETPNALIDSVVKDIESLIESYSSCSVELALRMSGDEKYFCSRLKSLKLENSEMYLSFSKDKGKLSKALSLSQNSIDELLSVLRELHNKEYKTTLSFCYVLIHSAETSFSEIFYDLLLESHSHQIHYAKLLSTLGFLELPTPLKKEDYMVSDIKQFIEEAIAEEQLEQVELANLAESIPYDEFQELVLFVQNQERHHLELLRKAYSTIA